MDKLEKQIVISEFEKHLKLEYGGFRKEVLFNTIMDTKRQFRADYFLPEYNIIVEVNGGQWTGGRHTRAGKVKGSRSTQYEKDLTKLNLAQKHGYAIYQFTYEMLLRMEYKQFLQ